ncbi:hypothetical protein GOODEAATRI_013127 [Goodea atripinnis]|uniref:Uncharacterized protein n=1 Tax=Goodea atripinnis TaxID=208336 RepID=A0ABV0NWT8_9TELE
METPQLRNCVFSTLAEYRQSFTYSCNGNAATVTLITAQRNTLSAGGTYSASIASVVSGSMETQQLPYRVKRDRLKQRQMFCCWLKTPTCPCTFSCCLITDSSAGSHFHVYEEEAGVQKHTIREKSCWGARPANLHKSGKSPKTAQNRENRGDEISLSENDFV